MPRHVCLPQSEGRDIVAELDPSANIITRAVGAENLEPDKVNGRLFARNRFLLCSKGIFKTLPEPCSQRRSAALPTTTSPAVTVEALGDG